MATFAAAPILTSRRSVAAEEERGLAPSAVPVLVLPTWNSAASNRSSIRSKGSMIVNRKGDSVPLRRSTPRGLAHFFRDNVKTRQIAQTIRRSFCRENCACPSLFAHQQRHSPPLILTIA